MTAAHYALLVMVVIGCSFVSLFWILMVPAMANIFQAGCKDEDRVSMWTLTKQLMRDRNSKQFLASVWICGAIVYLAMVSQL